ncbi:MAG TPA: hypothetical protein PKA05_10230 [Roseiflexaceae bacterium]|nr:hypothetical protein [Roseiflexaceae bacterium]HMP40745.1 hypothetical protein [Roseiflexaceae bacterium]
MAITTTENGETLITGQVADQAELHGLLRQVRDLGLKLLAVNQCDPAAGSPQLPSPRSATEQ